VCGFVTRISDGIALAAPALADTVSGIDPDDFAFLADVERWYFWFVARRALIAALAARYAPTASRFIEIGCGSGNVINALTAARAWDRVIGTDLHPKGLSLARSRLPASVELLQVDARRIPFRNAFDLAGAFDVLEHIAEDELAIAQIHGVLVDGGVLIATVPQHRSLWSHADEAAHHVRRYQAGELEARLSDAGFQIVFSTSYAVSLLPFMAAQRLIASRRFNEDARTTARREFAIPSYLNRLLTAILSTEVALTRRGLRWPAGGSRVVVARKPSKAA
jgi:SAM-dependent methyltransferase